jgi:Mg2+ and Co2+ transporter CorA
MIDHILLLQTSLQHYEYILSHCQPAYLSHLHVSFNATRGSIATNILILSVVTISILPLQFITGTSPSSSSSSSSPSPSPSFSHQGLGMS